MSRLRALLLVLCCVLSWQAQAHAFLDRAQPRVGSTLAAAPPALTLEFTQDIEPAFSSVKVTDANGRAADKGDISVTGAQMQVSLQALAPGDYTVKWRVVSTDTHVTEGDFVFHIGR